MSEKISESEQKDLGVEYLAAFGAVSMQEKALRDLYLAVSSGASLHEEGRIAFARETREKLNTARAQEDEAFDRWLENMPK